MRTLLSTILKEQLLKKRNLLILLMIPIVVTYICSFIDKEARDRSKVYSVAIIDNDKTELSTSFIENMKEYDEIEVAIKEDLDGSLRRLSRGKYDVVYEIKDGFQNKLLSREFDDILISHKEVNSTAVKWLNDQVSLIVVRKWLYVDALDRIRALDPNFREEEFKERFEEYVINNKILFLKIHNINNELPILEDNDIEGVLAFKTIWACMIIFFMIGFGKKVVDDRERGIILRLELSGFKKLEYYVARMIVPLINIMIPFSISYLLMGYLDIDNIIGFIVTMLFTMFYSIFTWLIVIFIGYVFKSKKSYSFASQIYLLTSIILGSGLLDKMHKLVDYTSWLLPIKWYINF